MHEVCCDSESERAAVAPAGEAVVASSRPCPVCGAPMTARKTSACSDRCRVAKSRRQRSDELARLEAQAAWILMSLRALRSGHGQR